MAFKFGRKSVMNYAQLSPELKRIAARALDYGIIDFSIDCAYRSKAEQNRLFNMEPPRTKVRWPRSKHNHLPAIAMDLVPYVAGASSWNHYHCSVLAGLVLAAAFEEGVKLRWGGNWDMDSEPITDQDFQDLVHFEKWEDA